MYTDLLLPVPYSARSQIAFLDSVATLKQLNRLLTTATDLAEEFSHSSSFTTVAGFPWTTTSSGTSVVDGPRCDNGIIANCHAGIENGLAPNPDVITDRNGFAVLWALDSLGRST